MVLLVVLSGTERNRAEPMGAYFWQEIGNAERVKISSDRFRRTTRDQEVSE